MSIIRNSHSQRSTASVIARGQTTLVVILSVALILLALNHQEANASIGYFEAYGWPTYGIVKPFWMTPFSAFPSRSLSGYSRKHPMRHGRGLINYEGFR